VTVARYEYRKLAFPVTTKHWEFKRKIPILPTNPIVHETALQLAATFQLPIVDSPPPDLPLLLYLTPKRLELRDMIGKMGAVYVDFESDALSYRCRHGGGRKQALAKAIGLKHANNLTVIDATAGLGRDAFILAHLGCHVQMIERSPVVAALLQDGLQRAKLDARLQLIHHDAQHWLLLNKPQPDVIYLDPMYPHRNKSALVKKEMRLLRAVVGEDLDAPALLETALACARRRVVVKRPKWAPSLAEPSFCIESEKTRFYVYV